MKISLAASLLFFIAITGRAETILRIHYKLECKSPGFRTIPGTIEEQGHLIRFDLPEGETQADVLLGNLSVPSKDQVRMESSNPACKLKRFSTESLTEEAIDAGDSNIKKLVIQNSPFLVVRGNQYKNRFDDLPLKLAYSVRTTAENHQVVTYTMFFSDEDSKTDSDSVEAQMTRYGRRTDVEWLYEVEIDSAGKVIRRNYQGDIFAGMGHLKKTFNGKFLSNEGSHPVLYNIADHNVFSDSPRGRQVGRPLEGYALVPEDEIPFPRAREMIEMKYPWIDSVSDAELMMEKKLTHPMEHYLLVALEGRLADNGGLMSGGFQISVKLDPSGTNRALASEKPSGDIDRLGEDLWEKEEMTGVPLGLNVLEGIAKGKLHGKLKLLSHSWFRPRLKLDALKFFRRVRDGNGVKSEEISSRFRCHYLGLNTECEF